MPFSKVLIANRGEIACRIIRACQQLGIRTVAVHSDVDRNALHVQLADEAYEIGGAAPGESYLVVDRIVDVAERSGAEAVHPGYGFLSERAAFAEAVRGAGLTFIGPSAEIIARMGDKQAAREVMIEAGVPVVPGVHAEGMSIGELAAEARKIGFPVMIKAVAGGGGKGMRAVHEPKDFVESAEGAAREAKAAFGDGTIYIEKLVIEPRHVELQVLGDHHGNVVHLFERECSIQRRHQKMLEETPSTALDDTLRMRMCAAAVQAAQAIGYTNAGTVEFLLDPEGHFYFLEMNTRLQVEHPITEFVTGLDLVKLQLRIAAGEPIPFTQTELHLRGHAIECRIYAEDAEAGFLPSTGEILRFDVPEGYNVRVDRGVQAGDEVTVHYDPMLAKLVTYGESRAEAIRKMRGALHHFVVHGVKTNIPFLHELLGHHAFELGATNTAFIENYLPDWSLEFPAAPPEVLLAAALYDRRSRSEAADPERSHGTERLSPWTLLGNFRLAP